MNIKKIKINIRKVPMHIWLLIAITAVGIFLRTYHFHDWLLFNSDQARDATVVDDIVSGRSSWIVLGPEAGNTRFHLGPWFYHLEAISAKIFGSSPDAMAYPDLFFSVLSIPLFYFFLKKYFHSRLALSLTALYSISFFAVRYSRFAWNPNSIPFFVLVFLFGILFLFDPNKKKSYWGAILTGIGIGVGIQLHILLFFVMLFVTSLFFTALFFRKSPFLPKLGKLGLVIFFILVVNIGQIIFQAKYGARNTKKFIKSSTNSTVKMKLWENLKEDFLCHSQTNLHLISSVGNLDKCDFSEILEKYSANKKLFLLFPDNKRSLELIAIGIVFTLAGYFFLAYRWRKETDRSKKIFLALIGIYGIATFIALFPNVGRIEIRYYIVSFFLPFVFLGIMAEALLHHGKVWAKVVVAAVFASLFYLNFSTEVKIARTFFSGQANNAKFIYLGETEAIADYLAANDNGTKTIYLRGSQEYEKRYFKPLNYILSRRGYDLARPSSEEGDLVPGAPIFFIEENRYDKYRIGDKIGQHSRVAEIVYFGNVKLIIPREDEE